MLSIRKIDTIKTPGRYVDGQGLILSVRSEAAKSWIVRVQHNGRRRDFGLGRYPEVSLAEAREKALETRKLVRAGSDPVAAKRALRASGESLATFRETARAFHQAQQSGWKNAKHRAQWLSSLEAYAFPSLGDLRNDDIDARLIVRTLSPIWQSKPETARRVRQRICAVLGWANANGARKTEAPCQSLAKALPKQLAQKGNFAALPYAEAANVMAALLKRESMGSLALMFLILTAARSGEVRGATWEEIDFDQRLWVIPAGRMKAGREHVVPLSDMAIDLLSKAKLARTGRGGEPIFPGRLGRPLSDMTLAKALRQVTSRKATVHGFRSTFRDWAAEKTDYADSVVEAALAHINPNRVERAYRRTIFAEKRKPLMDEWANFVRG